MHGSAFPPDVGIDKPHTTPARFSGDQSPGGAGHRKGARDCYAELELGSCCSCFGPVLLRMSELTTNLCSRIATCSDAPLYAVDPMRFRQSARVIVDGMAVTSAKSGSGTKLYLVVIAGPRLEPLQLADRHDRPQGLTIGRHDRCDLKLPAGAECISRFHARFRFDVPSAQWRVFDLGSSWGTFLNGVRLTPHAEVPLAENDQLRLEPWTFSVSSTVRRDALLSADDLGQSSISTIGGAGVLSQPIREDLLALLLEAAAAIHKASNEAELAQQVLDVAVRGSGFPNAAILRPVDSEGQIEVVARRTLGGADDGGRFTFSRSLLNAASKGQFVELSLAQDQAHSIVQLNIAAAVCVPLMLGSSPAAFLYLDARTPGEVQPGRRAGKPNAATFCAALGTLAGLALANLKRMDVERRQALIEHDLNAAAAAQKWLLPQREMSIAPFSITGESRPGRYVGGDFFDVIDLGGGRLAVALGDVSGKGVDASVLMTATQGFLHSTLLHVQDLSVAASAVNRFVNPRRPGDRFITLWIGVFDAVMETITYMDAGHSYAVLVESDGAITRLDKGGGPPLGVIEDYAYIAETAKLPVTGRMVVVSDGIVEQRSGSPSTEGWVDFNMKGVCACLNADGGDDLAEIFTRLVQHAGTTHFADDATGLCVRW